jgi:Holliday junction resolvase RusA-like endonuclease
MFIELKGQVRGGKNAILITRSGHRYPNVLFAKWSHMAVLQVNEQLRGARTQPIDNPDYLWQFDYVPEDHRRRDVPAILDAVFHVLEKAKVVADDRWVANLVFRTHPPSREGAGMKIEITPNK